MRPYASRVAVLPFESFDPSPDQARLARGFREDLIIELARFPTLGVIAARSTEATLREATSEEGVTRTVDYVVAGALRRSGGTMRVQARLSDTRTGEQLWAERYDRPEQEVFAIQDEIAARVANVLHARIDKQNLAAARRRSITGLDVYEAWLRGFELLQQGTLAADAEARRFFERSLELDPQFARGYAGLSLSYFNEWSCNAWDSWEETERRSFAYAQRAEALDPHDQVVQIILGRIEQYRRRFAAAENHLRRALMLAPNDADSLIQLGTWFALQGEPELGVKLAERGLDLNPLCPVWRLPYAALPQFVARQYQPTMTLLQKAPLSLMVDLPAYYAAAAAYAGDVAQARGMIAQFDAAFQQRITPGRRPEKGEALMWLRHVNPYQREADIEHLVEGVERARSGRAPATRETRAEGSRRIIGAGPRLLAWPVTNTFRREGALWTVCFEHRAVHVPDLKGFHDLACLLARPNEEVHCLTLAGREQTAAAGGVLLDERARRDYQRRMSELRAEASAATDANDPGRAARAQEELDALMGELIRATGIGGRRRKLGDPAEKARTAVTWRIRKAIKTLGGVHAELGRHLEHSVQTGVFCRYSPEKPVSWIL